MKINEELNTLKESMKYVLESDPRNFTNPYHENGWIYDKVYSWIKGIEEINEQFEYRAPASDVRPVVRAQWIEDGDNQPISCDKRYCCSNCHGGRRFKWQLKPFCEECGADMREDKKE